MIAPKPRRRLLLASTGLGAVGLVVVGSPLFVAVAAEQHGRFERSSAATGGGHSLDLDTADAEALKGFPVINADGQQLGRVVGVVDGAGSDGVRYAVLSTRGVPGVGGGLYPVPVGALYVTEGAYGAASDVPPADRRPGEPEPTGLLGLRVEEVVDRDVWSETGEPVARIEDVAVVDERLHLVLSVGGFLGLADREVALPVERFELRIDDIVLTRPITEEELEAMAPYRPMEGQNVPPELALAEVMTVIEGPGDEPDTVAASPEAGPAAGRALLLDIDRERLSRAPGFGAGELSADAEPAWRDDVLAFYRTLLPPGVALQSPRGAEGGSPEQPVGRTDR